MKRLLIIAALLLPLAAGAQDFDFGARASAGVDVKLRKGLHLEVEEEVRAGLDGLSSLRSSAGLTYKINKHFKVGGGYILINPFDTEDMAFKAPRHRFYADVTGSYKVGKFQFSLRERFQLTQRTGEFNVYQNTPNEYAIRTRFGAKYKGIRDIEPYAYFDLKTLLNQPWGEIYGNSETSESGKTYYKYVHSGYTHIYNSRYRLNLGCDFSFYGGHSLTPFVLLDYCSEYNIDTSADGTRLFTATTGWTDTFRPTLGVSYKFSF